ncbi:MAG: Gfo/Idh/MocA family protein [Nitrospinaceae bacterium]
MADKPIRIGLIGAGSNTRKRHLPLLQDIEGVVVTEVANRTPESAGKVAREFKIPRIRKSWEEVASSPEVDAVVIGAWPNLHCPATCMALESGKHVLCEARMAMDAAESRKMLAAARKNPHLIAQVVPSPFTLRVDQTVKRVIEEGRLGEITHFNFEYHAPPQTPAEAPLHWRRDKNSSGLNAMVLGIVYESILRWLGPAEWVSAVGHVFNHRAFDPISNEEVEVEIPDYLAVQMKLKNGAMGSMLLSETASSKGCQVGRIFGKKAMLQHSFEMEGDLLIGHRETLSGALQVLEIRAHECGGWRVEEEFINAIRGLETIQYTSFETGVQYMVFTEAVHRSYLMDGAPVPLSVI